MVRPEGLMRTKLDISAPDARDLVLLCFWVLLPILLPYSLQVRAWLHIATKLYGKEVTGWIGRRLSI